MDSRFDIVKKELITELENISNLNIKLSKIQEDRRDYQRFRAVGGKSNPNQQTIDKTLYDDICSLLQENTETFTLIQILCQQPKTENQIPSQDADKLTDSEKQLQGFVETMWATFREILSKNRRLVEIVRTETKKRFIGEKYEKANVIEIIADILKEISEVRQKIDDLWKPPGSGGVSVETLRLPYQETDSKSELSQKERERKVVYLKEETDATPELSQETSECKDVDSKEED